MYNPPDGTFDYFGVVSSFFLLFPFIYQLHKKIAQRAFKRLQQLCAVEADNNLIDSNKIKEEDSVYIENVNAFINPLLKGIRLQFRKQDTAFFLAVAGVLMFLSTQLYMYLLVNLKEYSWIEKVILYANVMFFPLIMNFIIGFFLSIWLFFNLRVGIDKINNEAHKNVSDVLNGKTFKFRRNAWMIAYIVCWVLSCIISFFTSWFLPYFGIYFVGLLIMYSMLILTYLWYKKYITITLEGIQEMS